MTKQIKQKTANLNITDKAIIIALNFKKLGNHRKLNVNQYNVDADRKMVTASKRLLDSDELKAISKFDSQTWQYVASRALPSMLKSFWMLPIPLVEEVDAMLEARLKQRNELVENFLFAYPNLIKTASALLRTTFNEMDYPTVEQVRSTFGMYWRYVSFGVPEQLEAIKADVFKREQEKAVKHWEQATTEMQNLLRANMADMVEHMIDRLTPTDEGKLKIFRSSMLDNVHDFLTTFEARNITDDAELTKLVAKARGLVDGVDTDTVKTDAAVREKIRKGMTTIKSTLDKLVVVKPTRKLRFGSEDQEAA
jgi:hypothetical protein